MFPRLVNISESHSFFLFGPRGAGKSTLLKTIFNAENSVWIDLLDPLEEEAFTKNPGLVIERWKSNPKPWVVIDEVQKIPRILDVVHLGIENHGIMFALTGSSARKLKRGSANMLAGRAFLFNLFPLCSNELGNDFVQENVLMYGSLPEVFKLKNVADKKRFLKTYALGYLKEEVQAEQLVRNLDPFRKFLEVAAQANGEIINYSNVARSCGVDHKTAQSYYQILSDTLIGFFLDSYSKSMRSKQIASPKFYFFDTGVTRALQGQLESLLTPSTYGYGKVFEHFVILEILKLNEYMERGFRLSYLRSNTGLELDLIMEKPDGETILVELKSSSDVQESVCKNLVSAKKDVPDSSCYVLCNERCSRITDSGVKVMNWRDGIADIFGMDKS